MSINNFVGSGHAGRDPECRYFESGTQVANWTIALNKWKKDGKDQPPVWVPCTAWGKTAQQVADYIRKGTLHAVIGRLDVEEWTDRNSGETRTKLIVVADRVELLGKRDGSHEPASAPAARTVSAPAYAYPTNDANDEIPF